MTIVAIELRETVRLALPLAMVQLGQQLMGAVDTAIVGRLGAVPLGAVGLANGLFFPLFILGAGVIMGLEPMIAQAVGAGDELAARRHLWSGAWLSLLSSLLLAPVLMLLPLALEPAGIAHETSEAIRLYLWARIPGVLPMLAFFPARQYLQALHRTRPLVLAIVAGNVVNIPATLLLVYGGETLPPWLGALRAVPALGVMGAGIGTSVGALAQVAVAVAATGRVGVTGMTPAMRRPERAELRRALRIGMPVALHYFAEIALFATVGFLAGYLDPRDLAAHQVALTLASLSFTVAMGIGAAGSVRVGRAVGARDPGGPRRAGVAAFAATTAFMSCAALLFITSAPFLCRLFTDQADVVAVAVPLLSIAAAFQLADGLQSVGAGVLRGAGETRYTLTANLLGHWLVGMPLAVALGFGAGMGIVGLWWGLCAGLVVVAVLLIVRFVRLTARDIAPISQS